MKRKRCLKKSQVLKITKNRREYKILHTSDHWLEYECCCCPMNDHCFQHKHLNCKPNRIRERNWKSQRKTQWKN